MIAASIGPGRDVEGDAARLGWGRLLAMLAAVLVTAVLAVLPALIATGAVHGARPWVAAVLGSLVAWVGGVKLAAVAWGLFSRFRASAEERRAAASAV